MSDYMIRNARTDEEAQLRAIWRSVFGNIGEDAFFKIYFDPNFCVVVEHNNALVSMGYLVPFGKIATRKKPVPCAMIYAIATLPEFRNSGYGRLVVNKLINLAHETGYPAAVLCPSDGSLFEYYNKYTEMSDWFYIFEQKYKYADFSVFDDNDVETHTFPLIKISAKEYYALRNKLLKKVSHISLDYNALEYQEMICKELGGGFYKIDNSCAAIEFQPDGSVWLKELLIPAGKNRWSGHSDLVHENLTSNIEFASIIASIAHAFPDKEYLVRLPAPVGKGRRFGMLATANGVDFVKQESFEPWYGLAFD